MTVPEGLLIKALIAMQGAKSTIETGDVIVSFFRQIVMEIDDHCQTDEPIDASYAFDWMGKIDLLANKLESELNILSGALAEAGVSPRRCVEKASSADVNNKIAA